MQKPAFDFLYGSSRNDAMGTLGKKGNKVFELPVLSFHFISLPRHTARRAHLDLGLGPRMTNAGGAFFSTQFFPFFNQSTAFVECGGVGERVAKAWYAAVLPAPVVSLKSLVIMPSALPSAGKNA